eukprot:m.23475 g.23475  ORF g.23475 m.23475 type:complete len:316 (+) comp11388_c0_seq1:83-1030(+)
MATTTIASIANISQANDVAEIKTSTIAASLAITGLVALSTMTLLTYLCVRAARKKTKVTSRERLGRLFWVILFAEVYLIAFAVIGIQSMRQDLQRASDSNEDLWTVYRSGDVDGCPLPQAAFCCKSVEAMSETQSFSNCSLPTDCVRDGSGLQCCDIAPGISGDDEFYLSWMWVGLTGVVVAALLEVCFFLCEVFEFPIAHWTWAVLAVDGSALVADGFCNMLLMVIANELASAPGSCFLNPDLDAAYSEAISAYDRLLSDFASVTWIFIVIAMLLTTTVLSFRLGFPALWSGSGRNHPLRCCTLAQAQPDCRQS